jgi:hypothetical protein
MMRNGSIKAKNSKLCEEVLTVGRERFIFMPPNSEDILFV